MTINLTELQNRIAAIVDQDANAPAIDSDDWSLRLKYLNLAQNEWAEAYPWSCLYKEYSFLVSTATSLATCSLPSDFRKLAGYPKVAVGGAGEEQYVEIRPQEKERYSISDRYCFVLGTPANGYNLIINPPCPTGASILVPYISTPCALATVTDVSPCPNPSYLVQRAVSLLWEAREDARFPQAKAEADKILARLLELENTPFDAAVSRRVETDDIKRHNFRWGRDG